MKSIPVATDFSDAAKNATNYSAQLAKQTDEFTLSHQNEIGLEMSVVVEQSEPEDIHERE